MASKLSIRKPKPAPTVNPLVAIVQQLAACDDPLIATWAAKLLHGDRAQSELKGGRGG